MFLYYSNEILPRIIGLLLPHKWKTRDFLSIGIDRELISRGGSLATLSYGVDVINLSSCGDILFALGCTVGDNWLVFCLCGSL
jgi:hypothetical protein